MCKQGWKTYKRKRLDAHKQYRRQMRIVWLLRKKGEKSDFSDEDKRIRA